MLHSQSHSKIISKWHRLSGNGAAIAPTNSAPTRDATFTSELVRAGVLHLKNAHAAHAGHPKPPGSATPAPPQSAAPALPHAGAGPVA